MIPGFAQRVKQVGGVVVEGEAAVREAEHAVGMGALSGEQGGAAGGAGGRGAEGLAEEDAAGGEFLQVGGRHGVAERLQVAAGIVRMQVDDVGRGGGGRALRRGRTWRRSTPVTRLRNCRLESSVHWIGVLPVPLETRISHMRVRGEELGGWRRGGDSNPR